MSRARARSSRRAVPSLSDDHPDLDAVIDMQAIANNPTLAHLRGIFVQRTLCAAWVLGSLLAALAGVLIASVSVVSVEGAVIGVSAIVAALIGLVVHPLMTHA